MFMTHTRTFNLAKKRVKRSYFKSYIRANGLKAQVGAKKPDDAALTVTTQENSIKKTFDRRFAIPLDFDFFKHFIHMELKKF